MYQRETLDRRQEGLFLLATLRPVGIVLMLGLVAYLIKPASMTWSSLPVPTWLRWTGVGICAMADGLLIWAFRHLGRNLTDTVVTRREHTLVIDGPYHWVRHPFYGSVALFVLSHIVDRGELVSVCDRRVGHWSVDHPDAD